MPVQVLDKRTEHRKVFRLNIEMVDLWHSLLQPQLKRYNDQILAVTLSFASFSRNAQYYAVR